MPLRVRLTLWYGTALAVILMTFALVLYAEMGRGLKDQVDRSLEEAAAVAIRSLESSRFGPFLQFEDLSAKFPELAVLDKFFQIFSPAGKITIQSPHIRSRDIPLSRTALAAALAGKTTFESIRCPGGPALRLASVPVKQGCERGSIVRVGTSLPRVEEPVHGLLFALAV